MVVQLLEPLTHQIAADTSSIEMCGKLQPQDSSKELFAADALIEGELGDQVSGHHDADMPKAAQATVTGASV